MKRDDRNRSFSTNTKLAWSELKRTGSSFHAIFQKEKYQRYFA
ncbi:MAG: hypothetical protein Q7S06_01985 [Nanoarchaeota archaeon]|nr:hypothetical protein [Nanoarchaeota archaeon]